MSPWVGKQRVDQTIYDHTSLLASVKSLFGLPAFLTARGSHANSFLEQLSEPEPRQDAPTNLTALLGGQNAAFTIQVPEVLSAHQKALQALAARTVSDLEDIEHFNRRVRPFAYQQPPETV